MAPASVARDLDGDDLVAALAKPLADGRGGGERNLVLGRAPPAEHGHPHQAPPPEPAGAPGPVGPVGPVGVTGGT